MVADYATGINRGRRRARCDPADPCDLRSLAERLDAEGFLAGDWDRLSLAVPPGGFVTCAAMAFLCSWGQARVAGGRRIEILGDPGTCQYLSRMDLHRHLGAKEIEMRRGDETGRFMPLRLIASADDTGPALREIRELIVHQFVNADTFLRSACWAVLEILDNILNHAASSQPGAVCAQYFPQRHRLDVGISDAGRGILASLSQSRPLWSHGHAVSTALQRGVTRDSEVGQGNGLAGTREIATLNGGSFRLWTGNAFYRVEDGVERGFVEIPEVPGTGVELALDTRRAVNLRQTWMAEYAGASYLAEEAPLRTQQVLRMTEEVGEGGTTRDAARQLRHKIRRLLEAPDASLALDFDSVMASSSFLDELFGRLAKEVGPRAMRERLTVQNLDDVNHGLANVAISQRLKGDS